MKKTREWYCEQDIGVDPCEIAKEGRFISTDEAIPALDGVSNPRCPGKRRSGQPCGEELVRVGGNGDGFDVPKPLLLGAGGLVAIVLAGLLVCTIGGFCNGSSPSIMLSVEPSILVFGKADSGVTDGTIWLRNDGDGKLIMERIEASPSAFSPTVDELTLDAGENRTLFVTFRPSSSERIEGTLRLHHGGEDSPTQVRLVGNNDPWWVYRKLESSSDLLQ